MSEKVKRMAGKTLPIVMVIGLVCLLVGVFANFGVSEEQQLAKADTATTSVTIGNKAPEWTVDAQEVSESSSSTPTNVGDNVSWDAVATDVNGDDYYLLVCSTSAAPTANNGGAPECAGGATNRWAVSGATATGSTSTASYTTQDADPEANTWYAFICDGNSQGAQCNVTYKQGTGSTASPFAVNHRPDLDTISNNSPRDPGQTVTWSTNVATADPDSYGGQDTIRLHVCQSEGWSTSSMVCTGAHWCSSTAVASDPSCSYSIPSPEQDDTYAAYVYLVDNHGFVYSAQASSSDYDVANVAPTISSSTINLLDTDGVGNMVLQPAYAATATPGFSVTAIVEDNNSCQTSAAGNEIDAAAMTIYVYRSGVGYANCNGSGDEDPNNCYIVTGNCQIGGCAGPTDTTVNATCTFSLWFLAEPTAGADATSSPWYDQNWLASVKAVDDDTASSTTEDDDGNELENFLAYNLLTPSINYGTVSPSETSDAATTTLEATGNVGLDENLSGTDMEQQSGPETIVIEKQHYSTSSIFNYWDGVTTTATATEFELDCLKSTSTSSPAQKNTYWKILIPDAISTGVFNGTNTIAAVTSEGQEW